jgi:hypothetical protein
MRSIYTGLRAWLPLFILFCLYFITRLPNLDSLPIFTDEAIYIRWSQIGSRDANWRFISLTDGKQPLFTWIMMVYLKVFDLDPLVVGRLVSVSSGILTVLGIWFVAMELFRNRRIAFLSGFLYIIVPFGLFYDRLAIYDSLVAALSVWNLYIAIRLVREPALDKALIFGMTLAAGMLNKSSGFFGLYLVPFTLAIFPWDPADRRRRLAKWVGFVTVAAVLSQVFYSVLRLSPFFHMIGMKDQVFIYPFREWLRHPMQFFVGNSRGLFDWLINYLTVPVYLTAILSALALWKRGREKILLLCWWSIPFFALAMFGKVLYPRFILFMSIPFYFLSAITLDWILTRFKKITVGYLFIAIILLPAVHVSYYIISDPINAPILFADRGQMIDDWPAGGGIREVVSYLRQEAKTKRVEVYTDGTFGLLPYALEIYLVDNPNIGIHGLWPFPRRIPKEVIDKARTADVYVITNQKQDRPSWPIQLVASFQKGNRQDRNLRLYKVILPLAMR